MIYQIVTYTNRKPERLFLLQEVITVELLAIIGAAIVLAFIGAAILRKVGIPQTLGFMLAGVALGIIGVLTDEAVQSLSIFVSLALGLIGYNIGHELQSDNLDGRLRKLTFIVIIEASAAFLLVTLLTYLLTQQLHVAFIFGAIASATAPAATADVVWECETQGPLSSSLMFVLAADDIIAVILTNSALAYALWVYLPESATLLDVVLVPVFNIGGSAILGIIFGVLFLKAVDLERDRGRLLELELGMVILLIGVVTTLGMSDIFAAMVFGFIVGKYIPKDTEPVPQLLQRIMAPVLMIFFALVGARMFHLLTITTALQTIIITAILYLLGRTVAKYFGARLGSTIVGESDNLKKYLGSCLFCQAGVALGLSFIIEEQFVALGGAAAEIGILVLGVVALSTMVLEAVGPIAVKQSLKKAGELPEDGHIFDPRDVVRADLSSIADQMNNHPDDESDTGQH